MELCIVCKEPKGIMLLGHLKDDVEAPREGIYTTEPCDACKEKYLSKGVMILEANTDGVPTGDLIIVTEEAFKSFSTMPIPEKRIIRMYSDMFKDLFRKDNNED